MSDEVRYVAAGGVVVDGDRVLVLRRPKRGEVRLPKGHVDEGESLEAAALREVAEESGYTGLEIIADLGSQIVGFDRDGKHHVRTERYFLMKPSEQGLQPTVGEEQFVPMWLGWFDALQALTFEAEREWLRRARRFLRPPPDDLPDAAELVERARAAFSADVDQQPPMTLRGGSDVDSYDNPTPFDPQADEVTDDYIEKHAFFALAHLDPDSWRHHLPALISYSLARMHQPGDLAIEAVLWSLRPPDRDPPRLGSLTSEQEEVVVDFLDVLAFDHRSAYNGDAVQVLEEYWVPNALYRKRP
jgi:8-oxo-dGTP pyrophosphatase MutT (NUDIX family)